MSRQRDLNPRPTVYETVALPLSYVGDQASLYHNFIIERSENQLKNSAYGNMLRRTD